MSKLKGFLFSFYKNTIKKRKFRPFFAILFDKQFRNDLDTIYHYTKGCTKREIREIEVEQIHYSHKIFYWDYTLYLLNNEESLEITPIRVVYMSDRKGYLVADGNHRLMALAGRALRLKKTTITCEVVS